jgi:hypothetical protein
MEGEYLRLKTGSVIKLMLNSRFNENELETLFVGHDITEAKR